MAAQRSLAPGSCILDVGLVPVYDSEPMPLSDAEVRVLGALTEKERTTPDAYPLSLQGLLTACNQKTSRDPVMNLHLQEVQDAMQRLRERGLAATGQLSSDRVQKHRHLLGSALQLSPEEVAVLSVLMLRGPQTPGELRARTDRSLSFPDVGAVEVVLRGLADRPAPLVKDLGRRPGQSQNRWMQTFGGDEERMQPRVRPARDAQGSAASAASAAPAGGAGRASDAHARPGRSAPDDTAEKASSGAQGALSDRVAALEARLEALTARLAVLEARASGGEGKDRAELRAARSQM